jgi:hypothetical protein
MDSRDEVQIAVQAIAPWLPPWLQSALAAIDKSLDVRPAAIIEARLREFLESWRTELRRPLEGRYSPQFLDAQSLTQLLMLTVDAAARERLSEKRQMYGRLLARADTQEWGDKVGRIEEALDALVRMSEGDLRVLKVIMARVEAVNAQGIREERAFLRAVKVSVEDLKKQFDDLSLMGVKTYITRLERLGLLISDPELLGDLGTGVYFPTHLLDELIALTRSPSE